MAYENPLALLARLKLGREEFCQRLLTMLILGGPYPRWNTHKIPTTAGTLFLQRLRKASFGESDWTAPTAFVDEFDLPRKSDDEPGGAPDYAVLWDDRLWYIELKTEPGSHRPTQLPSYYALSAHHYPGLPVDITYLTPAMHATPPAVPPGCRYAHVTWAEVATMITQTWTSREDSGEAAVRDYLLGTIDRLPIPPSQWRTEALASSASDAPVPAEPEGGATAAADVGAVTPARFADAVATALDLAAQTARDGKQRGLDWEASDLEALQELRLEVRNRIRDADAEALLRRVMPWLWSASTSGGTALTTAGTMTGYELRLSRYQRPPI